MYVYIYVCMYVCISCHQSPLTLITLQFLRLPNVADSSLSLSLSLSLSAASLCPQTSGTPAAACSFGGSSDFNSGSGDRLCRLGVMVFLSSYR